MKSEEVDGFEVATSKEVKDKIEATVFNSDDEDEQMSNRDLFLYGG